MEGEIEKMKALSPREAVCFSLICQGCGDAQVPLELAIALAEESTSLQQWATKVQEAHTSLIRGPAQ
jgi:hypothetical protein